MESGSDTSELDRLERMARYWERQHRKAVRHGDLNAEITSRRAMKDHWGRWIRHLVEHGNGGGR